MATDDAVLAAATDDAVLIAPGVRGGSRDAARRLALWAALHWHRMALAVILCCATGFNLIGLEREGYANTYYAAAIKSMLTSWHNFFFASFDAAGFVSVDKPPLGLWVQVASARLFGFSGISILAPEAIAGVIAVGLLYYLVTRAFGRVAGLVAALALVITPISVVTDRNNTIDSLLILTLLLAAWAVSRAAERGSLRLLLLSAILVGLGFNIKMLQAYLVVPGFVLVYLLGAPRRWRARLGGLTLAALVLLVVSLSWAAAVDLTPAGARPFVSDSGTNSELSLILGYNGLGRLTTALAPYLSHLPFLHLGIDLSIVPAFAPGIGNPGLLRLLGQALGGQASWLLPLALVGLLGAVLGTRWRLPLDLRGQAIVLWGGWLLGAGAFFSEARFFHLYYLTMLAPPVAALAGIGLTALWRNYQMAVRSETWRSRLHGWLLPIALIATAWEQIYLVTSAGSDGWLSPLIAASCVLAAAILGVGLLRISVSLAPGRLLRAGRRTAVTVTAVAMLALLAAPATWAAVSVRDNNGAAWLPQAGSSQSAFGGGPARGFGRPGAGGAGFSPPSGQGRFPSQPSGRGNETGPRPNGGFGGAQGAMTFSGTISGVIDTGLLRYLEAHQGKATYLVATTTSSYASVFILDTNQPAMALGGYQGWDRIVSPTQLAHLVQTGVVRFIYLPAQGTQDILSAQTTRTAANGAGSPSASSTDQTNNDDISWVQTRCTAVPATSWQSGSTSSSQGNTQSFGAGGGFGSGTNMQLYDCSNVKR